MGGGRRRCRCTAALWLLIGLAGLEAVRAQPAAVAASGEAWLLTTVATGSPLDAVPLLVRVSTSLSDGYDGLTSDLGLDLKLQNASSIRFPPYQARCQGVLKEVRSLPAPKTCSTNQDGSRLALTFYRDQALRPNTTYLFVTQVFLATATSDVAERTVLGQIHDSLNAIDTFSFTLPATGAVDPSGPWLTLFQVAVATSAAVLQNRQVFSLDVTLAAQAGHEVDPRLQQVVLVWAIPILTWDFTAASPCTVQAAGGGAGTCSFLRFPASTPSGQLALNAIQLTPSDTIGASPRTFRLRLVAPASSGSVAGQHRWFAQVRRAGLATQGLLVSPAGVDVQLAPVVASVQASNVAAGDRNLVTLSILLGVSFQGAGLIRIVVPSSYSVFSINLDLVNYARLGGLADEEKATAYVVGKTVLVMLQAGSVVWQGVTYGVQVEVSNPVTAQLPPLCVSALQQLMLDTSRLQELAAASISTSTPDPWGLEVNVGQPSIRKGSIAFQAFYVLPKIAGASLAPTQYTIGSLGLLTDGGSVQLGGLPEFTFLCATLVTPATPFTTFPVVSACQATPGLLTLSLKRGPFLSAGTALSFRITVKNPSEVQAALIEMRRNGTGSRDSLPLAQLRQLAGTRTSWALFVATLGVPCQAQAALQSAFRMEAMPLYREALFFDSISTTGDAPGEGVFVNLRYRFARRLPQGSTLTVLAPYGFRWAASFAVDAASTGAAVTLPVSSVVGTSGALPHLATLLATDTIRPLTVYGLRAKLSNALVSPEVQEYPSESYWAILVQLPASLSSGDAVAGRVEAGILAGYQLSSLLSCSVQPAQPVFGSNDEVTVSFLARHSVFSTRDSVGSVQITAPAGYVFPDSCVVRAPAPTLDVPSTQQPTDGFSFFKVAACQGTDNRATVKLDPSSAILRGSNVRLRVTVANPSVMPASNFWKMATFQGFTVIEACEVAVPGFGLGNALSTASYVSGTVGEDLRPGARSSYLLSFTYPTRDPSEALAIASGGQTFSTITVTAPEGFTTDAACLSGANGAGIIPGVQVTRLPSFASCVGGGRVASISLTGIISVGTVYALSIIVLNPPANFGYSQDSSGWTIWVDRAAAGTILAPALQLLQDLRLVPGGTRERSGPYWAKLIFRTSTAVPVGGGVNLYVPPSFAVGPCPAPGAAGSWGLYGASGAGAVGDSPVAAGTACNTVLSTSPQQYHRIMLFPLAAALARGAKYLVAFQISNTDFASHAAETLRWSASTTDRAGETIDLAGPIDTFAVRRGFGSATFTPPALPSPYGVGFPVEVAFALRVTVRRGAVALNPPPRVQVACADTTEDPQALAGVPPRTTCIVEGSSVEWLSHRLLLRNDYVAWTASRAYGFRMLVYDPGRALPVYRRSWLVSLLSNAGTDSTGSSTTDNFVVGAMSVEQWRWRGLLGSLVVQNDNPALNRKYPTYLDLTLGSALAAPDAEVWIRPPSTVTVHPYTCRFALAAKNASVSAGATLVPIFCDVPAVTQPCAPFVWETQPCEDAAGGALADSVGFSHRKGLRVEMPPLPAGSRFRLSFDTTPTSMLNSSDSVNNVWTVSTWQGSLELDVAQVLGYAVRRWIEVLWFVLSAVTPSTQVQAAIEWWMLLPLPAMSRIILQSPMASGYTLFDFSPAAALFDGGNLPVPDNASFTGADPASLAGLTTSGNQLQLTLCCELQANTAYRFSFAMMTPPVYRMPAPSVPELNIWVIFTRAPLPSQEILHQQVIQGPRLARAFRNVTAAKYAQTAVDGSTATASLVQVALEFRLPFTIALQGPSLQLRVVAPVGWEFPATCTLRDIKLGPYTSIANCRAALNEMLLSVTGSINPGVENAIFGLGFTVQVPVSTSVGDIWVLQASAPVGSLDELVDRNTATRSPGTEQELRFSSTVAGLARPSVSGRFDQTVAGVRTEILAWVDVQPLFPTSFLESWRAPTVLRAGVHLLLPKDANTQLTNATLRISAEPDVGQLSCTNPPEPFPAGSLPPSIVCLDIRSTGAGAHEVSTPHEVILAVDPSLPLSPSATYEFGLFILRPAPSLQLLDDNGGAWPRGTSWSAVLSGGADQLRSVSAQAAEAEGDTPVFGAIGDYGLLTSTTAANTLAEVTLLFTTGDMLPLPLAIEVVPPASFLLDSTRSPLHPALDPTQNGVNPFRSLSWQEQAAQEAALAAARVASGEEMFGADCPMFLLNGASRLEVKIPPSRDANATLCTNPPTLDKTLLQQCAPEFYEALPAAKTRCVVLGGRAVLRLYRAALASYPSARDRDRAPCSDGHCVDGFDRPALPAGSYQFSLRGYNPPATPASDADNVWTMTIRREVQITGGGPRNVIDPVAAGQVPGYTIDASAAYSDKISPAGGEVLRGGAGWRDPGSAAGAPATPGPSYDYTQDGRLISLTGT